MLKMAKVALATARLAYLISQEAGPFNAFEELRSWVTAEFGTTSWVTAGIHCPLCVSFWLAGLVWLAPDPLVRWLATAEIARQLLRE